MLEVLVMKRVLTEKKVSRATKNLTIKKKIRLIEIKNSVRTVKAKRNFTLLWDIQSPMPFFQTRNAFLL